MSLLGRLTTAFALTAALLALGAGVAAAKVPYFSVELTPPAPTAGEPVTVVVRLWNDPAHTVPADWAPPNEAMDEMLAFVSDDEEVRIDLTSATDGTYRGTVTLTAGSWTMVPFPDGAGVREPIPGFQTPIAFTVSAPLAPTVSAPIATTTSNALPWFAPLAIGAALAGAAALAIYLGQRRRSFPRPQEARPPA